MFDWMNGGDDRLKFLVDYLVEKEIVTPNAATWINEAGGLYGLDSNFIKTYKKEAIFLMDKCTFEDYRKWGIDHLYCKKCNLKVKISFENLGFLDTEKIICEKCGEIKKEDACLKEE